MRVWIGHYSGNPHEWFLAWGETRTDVVDMIRGDLGEPDEASIKPVRGQGYFVFQARASQKHSAWTAELEPSEGEYLILYDKAAENWIVERVTRPRATD